MVEEVSNSSVIDSAQNARNTRIEPPAPSKEDNTENQKVDQVPKKEAPAVIAKLAVIDVVERERAPEIDPIPKQVKAPNPFDDTVARNVDVKDTGPLPELIKTNDQEPEETPAATKEAPSTPPPTTTVETLSPESRTQGEADVVTPPANDTAEAPEQAPVASASPKVEAGPAPANDGNAQARAVQRDQAEGQATNHPIAEQEIGGTVNVAV